ncbi:MAG: preprotein translocase subunit SecG [Candidatus Ancillula sp.]|jgi:preprotein translocase subunit SecG|nr:preprotein translocase subunit SecG [Candidatus Ancillula sp.]
MGVIKVILDVLLVVTSVLLVLLILLHKGRGGGLSDMFGGGIQSSAGSSGVAEKNLNRFTLIMALLWTLSVILIGVLTKLS